MKDEGALSYQKQISWQSPLHYILEIFCTGTGFLCNRTN